MSDILDQIKNDIEKTKQNFPFIEKRFSSYPGYDRYDCYLIPKQMMEKMFIETLEEAKPYSFHVSLFVSPKNYRSQGPIAYDVDGAIDWSLFDNKDIHYNLIPLIKNVGVELCTHVKEETSLWNNPFYEVANSAYCMYSNYMHVKSGGKSLYHGYSHGIEGIKESRSNYGNKTKIR